MHRMIETSKELRRCQIQIRVRVRVHLHHQIRIHRLSVEELEGSNPPREE